MSSRAVRIAIEELCVEQGGVFSREQARALGADRWVIAHEVARQRWVSLGSQTVSVHGSVITERGLLTSSVWEAGQNAALDGISSLRWAGLKNFDGDVHLIAPWPNGGATWRGSRVHNSRLWTPRDLVAAGPVRRTRNEVATVRAAMWAKTDRAAATVMAMAVQQRISDARRLLLEAKRLNRHKRRPFILLIAHDIAEGAQALGELDFAKLCRGRGLPEPDRQVMRRGPRGRIYVDVLFDAFGVVVEIEGVHHDAPENVIDDAVRQNALTIGATSVLRVPVLGIRVCASVFLDQLEQALLARGWTRAA